jgi:hypothetical protein
MEQTVTAVIMKYNIIVEPLEGSKRERLITVEAVLATPHGVEIGTVETDVFEFAPNLALALVKAWKIDRQIAKGTVVPDLDF